MYGTLTAKTEEEMTEVFVRSKREVQVRGGKLVVVRTSKERKLATPVAKTRNQQTDEQAVLPSAHVIAASRSASALSHGLSTHQARHLRGRRRG